MANRLDFERLWQYVTTHETYALHQMGILHDLFPMFTIWQIAQLQKIIVHSRSQDFKVKVARRRFFDQQGGLPSCRGYPKHVSGDEMSVLQEKAYKEWEDRYG